MTDFDVVIVGAGVVGLACGHVLSLQGLSVVVMEAETMLASVTSARNSEVIHAGLYYPTNSFKHLLCVRGRHLLMQFVNERQIAHRKCGKLVVATTPEEQDKIEALLTQAQKNAVENVRLLTAAQINALEPDVYSVGGLFSGETGILDVHQFCHALAQSIEQTQGIIALGTPLLRARLAPHGFEIDIGGQEPTTITSRFLVNSAGLAAAQVARSIEGLAEPFCRRLTYAKGCYFSYAKKSPFSHLIYPAPVEGGLGVHATLDLGGQLRFGPDVTWLEIEDDHPAFDYQVDGARAQEFYTSIRRYWPHLPDNTLSPDYAGVRPKLSRRGEAAADFALDDVDYHGIGGLINLFGIESPGITASLAIAEEVANRLNIFL